MIYIVKQSDIGKGRLTPVKHNGKLIYPFEPLGRVLPNDVGKMLVENNRIWQAENNEQFQKRIAKNM